MEMIRTKRTLFRVQDVAAALVLAVSAARALAGDCYEQDGAAIKGYDPVAYFLDSKPVKGSPAYTAAYRGSVFHLKA